MALIVAGLGHAFRRHTALFERSGDTLPLRKILAARTFGRHLFEADSAHCGGIPVALETILAEGRLRQCGSIVRPPNRPADEEGHY